MLDAAALAKTVTSFLVPAIPYLLKGGEQAWGEASKKVGDDAWRWSKSIWTKLVSRSRAKSGDEEKNTEVVKAATEVAHSPSDKDAQAALRFQIKKLLTDDPELRLEIEEFLNEARNSSRQTSGRIGGVDISGGATVANSGNIVGGNQTLGN